MESVGTYTTKELNQGSDFDDVMLRFAQIANDDYWLDRLSSSEERRMIHLIKERLKALDSLEGGPRHTWAYARKIYDHMKLPEDMKDCPAQLLRKVFQGLDTHVRRLEKLDPVPF